LTVFKLTLFASIKVEDDGAIRNSKIIQYAKTICCIHNFVRKIASLANFFAYLNIVMLQVLCLIICFHY